MRTLRKVRNASRTGLHGPVCWAVMLVLAATPAIGQQAGMDWQKQVREQVQRGQLDAALAMVGARLAMHGEDLEAHAWRGRLLAWKGRWPQAEGEYRFVLQHVPQDVEVLTGLADVLLWQGRAGEALDALEAARGISPAEPDVLLRRARVLRVLGREREAREDFRRVLAGDPNNAEAKKGIAGQGGETRYELRVGQDVDTFNYTDSAQAQSVWFISRWSQRWSSTLGVSSYERLDETAAKFSGSAVYRLTQRDWLSAGAAGAHEQGLIPKREIFSGYGHGFRFANAWIRGWEVSSQQHWFWYRGAHVLTLGASQDFYLPKDWTWGFRFTEARSGFSGSGVEWVPSGSTRLRFPLQRRLTGNVSFAVGSENFARVDQIGRFAARTFAGGLRYQCTGKQDVSGYIAAQDRSQRRSQNSYGLSYGVRF